MELGRQDCKQSIGKRLGVLIIALLVVMMSICVLGPSLALAEDLLALDISPDVVDLSVFAPDTKLNPYDTTFMVAPGVVTAVVTSTRTYDLRTRAESNLVLSENNQPVAELPINNLYWRLPIVPAWSSFALSFQPVETGAPAGQKIYQFDYRVFSDQPGQGLGWEVKPGKYETTITYSVFANPQP